MVHFDFECTILCLFVRLNISPIYVQTIVHACISLSICLCSFFISKLGNFLFLIGL